MIINKEEYTLLEELIEIRNTFELKKHTPETVWLLISILPYYQDFLPLEQKKKILRFVNTIVHKYFVFDRKKKNLLEKRTNSFFKKSKSLSRKHKEFTYLEEDFEDGIIHWGKIIDIISIVIEIIEQGEHIEHIELRLALDMPIEAIRDFSVVFDLEKFKKLGPCFACYLNEIIYDCIPKEIIEGAFLTGLLEKEHELKQGYNKSHLEDIFSSVPKKGYKQAMQALTKGHVTPFVEFVKDYLINSVSYHDTGQKRNEPSYHSLLLGMSAFFDDTYHVRSNRESGHGRYDIALEPKHKEMKAIIIEFKVSKEGEDMGKIAQKAFDQIQVKQYKADMKSRGVTDFVLLGMAFRGKEVEVVTN